MYYILCCVHLYTEKVFLDCGRGSLPIIILDRKKGQHVNALQQKEVSHEELFKDSYVLIMSASAATAVLIVRRIDAYFIKSIVRR